MHNRDQFTLEVEARLGGGRELSANTVIPLLGWHTPGGMELTIEGRTRRKEKTDDAFSDLDPNYPFLLVMERGERSLHEACIKERFSGYNYDDVRSVIRDVAEGLQGLHRANLIHGDLKARNILHVAVTGSALSDPLLASP